MLDKPEIRTRILELLKSYPAIKQKITVLKREFENPHLISVDYLSSSNIIVRIFCFASIV